MRKREDVHAIGMALDYTAISPVANTFNWIGQRLAIIAIGVGEDGGDGHRAELGIIEVNDDAGPQDTFAPLLGHALCLAAIHAACDRRFDLLIDKGVFCRFNLFA